MPVQQTLSARRGFLYPGTAARLAATVIFGTVSGLRLAWGRQCGVPADDPLGALRGEGKAFGVNEKDEIVGTPYPEDVGQDELVGKRAVLWRDGEAVDRNTLVSREDAERFALVEAVDINERGQIVDWGVDLPQQPSNYERAFPLTPRCAAE